MNEDKRFTQDELDTVIERRLSKQRADLSRKYEREAAVLRSERDRLAAEVDQLREQKLGARLRRLFGRV